MMSLYCHRVASSVVPIPVCFANSSNGSTCHLCMHGQQCLAPTSVFSAVTICVLLAHGSVATLGGPWLVYPLGLTCCGPLLLSFSVCNVSKVGIMWNSTYCNMIGDSKG